MAFSPALAASLSGESLRLILLVAAAAIIGWYLWKTSRRPAETRADRLQKLYDTLTPELLDSVPDDELVDAVVANLIAKLDPRFPDDYTSIPLQSHGQCAVYSVWLTSRVLDSAGFEGYWQNPASRFIDLAIDGLDLIGADACAAVLKDAFESTADESAVAAVQGDAENAADADIKSNEPALTNSDYDSAWADAVASCQPLSLCVHYIRANPDEFVDNTDGNEEVAIPLDEDDFGENA